MRRKEGQKALFCFETGRIQPETAEKKEVQLSYKALRHLPAEGASTAIFGFVY